jgi:hypothetical protein
MLVCLNFVHKANSSNELELYLKLLIYEDKDVPVGLPILLGLVFSSLIKVKNNLTN